MLRVIVRVNNYSDRRYASVVSELLENVHGVLDVCRGYLSDAICLGWETSAFKVDENTLITVFIPMISVQWNRNGIIPMIFFYIALSVLALICIDIGRLNDSVLVRAIDCIDRDVNINRFRFR